MVILELHLKECFRLNSAGNVQNTCWISEFVLIMDKHLFMFIIVYGHSWSVVIQVSFYFIQVVMRRLPPSLTPESLIEQISPLPEHDFFYFVKADMRYNERAGEFQKSNLYTFMQFYFYSSNTFASLNKIFNLDKFGIEIRHHI